ncbi:hypothetical protein [Enterovirga rhinocerotis]|uniref:DUF7847 domain-containing protein n=1 Tax=Enterovirga rhinocerotis TaxID=1339210 RepID=A0A4R7BLZ9_9HYPH|nr:hypothetical protein [Enterovirga rhinocerotis]TDR85285.1 hypothetical protein EV668_4836 [Enterovirga rhinocerotis]
MGDYSLGDGAAAPGQFQVGPVISKAFAVLGRRFGKFVLLSLLPMAPLLLLILGVVSGEAFGRGLIVFSVLTMIATVVLQTAAQATTLYGAFQEMRGQPFTIGQSLRLGLARVAPVIGVGLLIGLAVGLGFLLFIVPGIIIGCMLYVAIPACVIEKKGVMASLRRSVALTKGHRWQIFGLFLLVVVITMAGGFVLQKAAGHGVFGQVLGFLWQVVSTAFGAVLSAVIYYDLRVAKEGIHLDTLANVFD